MKGSNIRRWGAALAVVIIAGAAYWFWHDRGTSGSGAPAAGSISFMVIFRMVS